MFSLGQVVRRQAHFTWPHAKVRKLRIREESPPPEQHIQWRIELADEVDRAFTTIPARQTAGGIGQRASDRGRQCREMPEPLVEGGDSLKIGITAEDLVGSASGEGHRDPGLLDGGTDNVGIETIDTGPVGRIEPLVPERCDLGVGQHGLGMMRPDRGGCRGGCLPFVNLRATRESHTVGSQRR